MKRLEYQQFGAKAMAVRGNDLPQAKLDADKVKAIRANRHGWTAKQWANHFGLHQRTIDKVRDGRSWNHVQ